MRKILISWYAYNHDFVIQQQGARKQKLELVNEDGPTFNIHRHFGDDYEKHILLCSSSKSEDKKFFDLLVAELKKEFKHKIESRTIAINDPINIEEIFTKISELLKEFKNSEVEIFVNPGTPQMQIAWYLAKPNFKRNVRLFQLRESRFTTKGEKPEKLYSNIDTLFNPTVLSIASEVAAKTSTKNTIQISDSIKPVYERAEQIAKTKNVGCLILGENGTGKENLASHIHRFSDRQKHEFKAVNCAAYSDDLLRSELFGHEKGSFTGADNLKIGLFEEANGGTIFLDEIGDISPKMQVSLLRVIQEKKIQRVGGTKDIPIDVRVIAATNRDLEEECEKGNFRMDLFFRLSVTILKLPAFRDWTKKEIKDLIEHFNSIYFSEFPNRQQKLKFKKEVIDRLTSYHFKGNIRELQNLIISLYTFCANEVSISDLPERITKEKKHPLSDNENIKSHTLKVLTDKKWNIKLSSEFLGIARETLYRRIKYYDLKNPNKK